MGLIDVNIERSEDESTDETETEESGGRGRRTLKAVTAFGAAIIGIITLRKLRARRRGE